MTLLSPKVAFSRRRFLAAGLTTCALQWLSACHRNASRALIYALGWVPDVEYAAFWIALERGYFKGVGVPVKVWPGGPNAPQPLVQVAARQAQIGDAEWLPLLDAINRGNDFVIIASACPVHPGGLISLARRPVREPSEMPNARYLVQGPSERTTIEATFRLNHLPPTYTFIPVGFSPDALLNGAGDAYYCFVTNQPGILEDMGMKREQDFFVRRMDELGYHVPSTLLFVDRRTLETRRAELVSFLKALLQGRADNIRDPTYAPSLIVNKYGVDLGLSLKQQLRVNRLQIPLTQTPGTRGPYWISQETLQKGMYDAARASGRLQLPLPERVMDMSLLADAYVQLGI